MDSAHADRPLILAIDDSAEYLELLVRTFHSGEFEIEPASSLTAARKVLSTTIPDFLILDALLPDGQGLDFCRELRRNPLLSDALILILSANRRIWSRADWLGAGADQCLPKIFNPERLRSVVLAMLRRRDQDRARGNSKKIPGLEIDVATSTIHYRHARSAKLNSRELAFLDLVIRHHPAPAPRDTFRQLLFSYSKAELVDLALNALVSRLKHKLPPALAGALRAVYKRGYALDL